MTSLRRNTGLPMPARKTSSTLRQFMVATDSVMRQELKSVVEDTSIELKGYFEGVVKAWTTKVRFRRVTRVSPYLISARVFAVGKNKNIWQYVDEGTKPHVIKPKNAPRLSFKLGYSARTAPGVGKGGSPNANAGTGQATGDRVFAMQVQHPGTKARQFAKTFNARLSPSYTRRIEAAIRRAVRRMN